MKEAIESLHPAFERLIGSLPVNQGGALPKQGVYLFTEAGTHLYVGRSNNIPARYRAHCGAGALENAAAFAMLLAREKTRIYANYRAGTGRKTLMDDSIFRPAFDQKLEYPAWSFGLLKRSIRSDRRYWKYMPQER